MLHMKAIAAGTCDTCVRHDFIVTVSVNILESYIPVSDFPVYPRAYLQVFLLC